MEDPSSKMAANEVGLRFKPKPALWCHFGGFFRASPWCLRLVVLNVEDVFEGQRLIGGLFFLNITLLESVRTCGQLCVGKRQSDFRKKRLKEAGEKCSSLQSF